MSWWRTDFAEGAAIWERPAVLTALAKCATPIVDDGSYLAMRDLGAFVERWHARELKALSNGPTFPDCDDFSALCYADIIRGAIEDGLTLAPLFGMLKYTKPDGKRHAVNFGVDAHGAFMIYEPQTGVWSRNPADVKTLDVAWL